MKLEDEKLHNQLNKAPKDIPPLEITTLGGLSIQRDGKPVDALHSRKAPALLVYLAVTERPQPREVLADLLWEDFSQQKAMNNLRVVLSNLRKHLGDHLLITRDTAAINLEVDYDLDVTVFDANLSFVGEMERKTGTLNQEAIARIEQAVEQYKGEFLAGFFVDQALEFEAWMVVERERLHHLVLDGLGKLVRWELAQGEYSAGIRYASRWVQLDPISEIGHRQMMRLLAFSGQRSAALAQYERGRDVLAEELGVEPDSKTTTLYEQIRDGAFAPDETVSQQIPVAVPVQADTRRHNLPVQTTPFIGREQELADLNQLFRDPDVRLVTILGAGGMGKTRLVLEAAESILDHFPDGVYFVSLARLGSEALIVPSIIQALGIEFVGRDTGVRDSRTVLKEILLRNLRRKQMLLILDNFEHLLDGVALVSEILQASPGVKVLATSRTRMNLGGEHRFQVTGMDYPADFKDQDGQKYSAVRLFLESARRAWSGFKMASDDMQHIANICRLVGGMPLSIRLAASWVDMLSPEEIAVEIAQNLDLLETDLQDIPGRQRSIRALYDHSWKLLNPREREVYQAFSIFRGGCTREAAQQITGATLRDLRCLADKSLLQRDLNWRYEIHEISREYAAEKLMENPESWQAMHSRHSIYYNNAVSQWGDDLKSASHIIALREMDLESDNARAAWHWAVEQCQVDLVDRSMEGFRHYFAIRNQSQEAERIFRQAVDRFQSASIWDELRVYARLISMQAYFSDGNLRKQSLYRQSLDVLDQLALKGYDVRYEKAQVLNFLGFVTAISNFDEAVRFQQDSLGLFKELDGRYWVAQTLFGLTDAYFLRGKLDDAEATFQESKTVFRELGDTRQIAKMLNLLTCVYRRQSIFEKAECVARERLEICETIGDPSAIADGQRELGYSLYHLGKFDVAETLLENAMAIHRELENYTPFFFEVFLLCLVKLDLGNYVQALDSAQSALDINSELPHAGEDWAGRDSKKRRLGWLSTIHGMASLALGNVVEAESFLQKSLKALQEIHLSSYSVFYHFVLGIVFLRSNQLDQVLEHICNGLQKGLQISSSLVYIPTLGTAALYFANKGDLERAVEIYALASRYHWIAKSKWYQDVIETPLSTLTASLSPEVVAAALERGRERELEAMVKELLVELVKFL